VCPDTICTEIDYSGNTLSFNVTSFTVYSAEQIPAAEEPSGDGAYHPAGGGVECTEDSQCIEDKVCWNYECVKLFDVKIIEFESPIKLGEFFYFTYFIKGMAEIHKDVEVSFWIEKNGEIITSGLDTIYLGSFEEKTETTKIFLPTSVKSGIYNFIVQVKHENYFAKSQRTIEITVKNGIVRIIPLDLTNLKTYIILILIILVLFILFIIFYLERKKIKRSIEQGLVQETRWFKKHKISVLVFILFIILGTLAYSLNLFGFLARWFKTSSFDYFLKTILILFGLLIIVFIINKTNFFQRFKSWRAKRREINRLKRAKRKEIEKLKKEKIRRKLRKIVEVRPKTKPLVERPRIQRRKFMKAFIGIITSPFKLIEEIAITFAKFSGKLFWAFEIFLKAIKRKTILLFKELKLPEKEGKVFKKIKKYKPTKKRKPRSRILFKLKKDLSRFYEWSKKVDGSLLGILKKTHEKFEIPELDPKEKISKFWDIGKAPPPYLPSKETQKELKHLGKLEKLHRKTELELVKIIKNSIIASFGYIIGLIKSLGSAISKKEKDLTREGGKVIKQIHKDIFYLLKKIFGRKSYERIIHDFENKLVKTEKFTEYHLKTLRDVVNARSEFEKTKANLYHDVASIRKKARVLIRDLTGYLYGLDVKGKKEIRKTIARSKRRSTNVLEVIMYDLRNTLDVIHDYLIKLNVFYLRARYKIKMKFFIEREEIVDRIKELKNREIMRIEHEKAVKEVEEILAKRRATRKKRFLEKQVFGEKIEKPGQAQKQIVRPVKPQKKPVEGLIEKLEPQPVQKPLKQPVQKPQPVKKEEVYKEPTDIIEDMVEKERKKSEK